MAFNLKPYKKILAMTAAKIDEALAPIRARSARARADLELCKLEEELASLETEIHNLCAQKELDFNKIADKIDRYELKERRKGQITKLINELFPQASENKEAGDGVSD